MLLKMFNALLPYFGGKRKLCPVIFRHIAKYLPREKWQGAVFVDAFLGSGAVSLSGVPGTQYLIKINHFNHGSYC